MITEIFVSLLVITAVTGYSVAHDVPKEEVKAQEVVVLPTPSPSVLPSPTPIPTDIVGYINYKFGVDAPKALLLLQGDGNPKHPAENKHFDPKAKNDNREWGGIGYDYGYWQFNNIYHPEVTQKCAEDVKCSTDRAYQMFKHDGSFKQWTAGRFYGI
jgi:hypothetical protein